MFKKSNKLIVCLFAFSLMLLVISGSVFAKDSVVIQMGHVGAPVSPQQGAADIFVKLVEEKTNGSVKVKVYGSSTLGDERELVEGMVLGTIDAGIVSSGLFGSYYPTMQIFEIPFLFRGREHANAVNNGPIGQKILDNLSKTTGVKAVALWEHGFRQVTNNVRPIDTPDDLKDLKIRSPEVPVYSTALRALGAVPIPMAFSELYVALERGVVDGQHNPLLHVEGQRFYEVQKYLSMMDFAYTNNVVAFSKKAWGKLTKEQQKQVIEAAKEAGVLWSKEAEKVSTPV
ncbi:MAG: hypothetical protein PWR10_720 [Halanaerobiales bacterium]|nr:hypothetical protein [Halanaerobiales bacterium]